MVHTMQPRWQIKKMIEDLGGISGVEKACAKAGLPLPKYTTVRMWSHRDSARASAVALLCYLLFSAGKQWGAYLVLESAAPEVDPFG